MERLVLPLLMYKESGSIRKGTKKSHMVVPSWNHVYTVVRQKSKSMDKKDRLQLILDKWAIEHKEKMTYIIKNWANKNQWQTTKDKTIVVKVWVFWNNAREKDCHNIDKLFMDAMSGIIYDDDCNALLQFHGHSIDRENPRIEIDFEVMGESIFLKKAR